MKKKIVHASTYGTLSGANRSLIALCIEEAKMGYEVFVIVPFFRRGMSDVEKELRKEGICTKKAYNTVCIVADEQKKSAVFFLKRLIKLIIGELQIFFILEKTKPDIFHINTLSSDNGYVAAKGLKIPVVWHIREFIEEDYSFHFINQKKIVKKLYNADEIIAISESIKSKFTQIIGRDDIKMIYNGIDVNKYTISVRKAIFTGKIRLSVIGRLIPGKGQKDVILALEKLRERGYSNIELYLFGGEAIKNYEYELREIADDMGLDVHFYGLTNDINKLYKDTDIVVVSSKSEPFGRVTIEGMLAGCLVIGADTAGTKELIQDGINGLLYQQGNPEDLAKKIDYALKNQGKMKSIVIYSQKWAKENFTAQKNAMEICRVFESI